MANGFNRMMNMMNMMMCMEMSMCMRCHAHSERSCF